MNNILKYQNPSSPLLNPHKIIENIPAREWGPRKINEDYTVTEGEGTSFLRAPFQYWGNKGLGLQNEKLARDLVSDFTWMMIKNPNYNPILDKNYQSYDDAVNYLNHLEGLKKYLGLPYDTGLLMESKYKPTRLQGTNEKTYKFKSSTVPGYWDDVVEDMVIGEHDKNQYYDQSLNEFTAYRDRDEKGDFVSIYDEWDYNPAVRGGNKKWNKLIDTLTGGTPFVIYDRVYLDDYYDIPEEARGNPFITPAVVTAYKKGGNIHIKKKNRGKFTEYCGGKVTEECIAKGKKSKDPKIRKRATFASNSRRWKHENGGILKAQEGTGNKFWSKLWNAVKEGGMAARDARLGAVGAQQVRDLYSEGKNQEAQDLAKQYAKANTTGIALAGGAASTGLLSDLMVTGATTAADTFIDGDTENFGKNLSLNAAFDLIGHGVGKLLRNIDWGKVRNSVELISDNTKVDVPTSKSTKAVVEESKPRWANTSQSKLTEWERLGIPKGDRNFDVQFGIARREGNVTQMQQLRDQHHFETFQKNKLVQNEKPIDWYHGSDDDFTEFDLDRTQSPNFFFSKDKNYVMRLMREKGKQNPIIKKYYLYSENPALVTDPRGLNHATTQWKKHYSPDSDSFMGADTGKDEWGFALDPTEIAIPYPRHIKSASPIVYDDNGHFIKLSKRDDIWNKDVRYRRGGKL